MRSLVAVAGLVACYHPSPPEGRPCSDIETCPLPQQCIAGTCTLSDAAVDVAVDVGADADLTCLCSDANTLTCATGDTSCALGCLDAPPHCAQIVPSNGLDLGTTTQVMSTIVFDSAVFDTDTGAITGSITRSAGSGVMSDIDFETRMFDGVTLGVFTFHGLHVKPGGIVQFTGAAAAVFLVGGSAMISGTIDGSGGCNSDPSCAGPGGGLGARDLVTVAGGCGPGATAKSVTGNNNDSGGGGGGGGGSGAAGTTVTPSSGGVGGAACLATTLVPLVGGSGGGNGSKSDGLVPGKGGGGGGAFQLTALDQITVSGTITMGGGGGAGGVAGVMVGTTGTANSGGGGGGGAGGAILLEAPTLTIAGFLAANGGGGGGGGEGSAAGMPGNNGNASTAPAIGGAPASGAGAGGNGGAGTTAPTTVTGATSNGGGGGGGVGAIYLRSLNGQISATTSPAAESATLPIQ